MLRLTDSKHRNVPRFSTIIGRQFVSIGECIRGEQLWLLQKGGQISDLKFQVRFVLGKPGLQRRIYVDFGYIEDGKQVYEDFKGRDSRDWETKRRWLWAEKGILVVLIRAENL